jgi:hypothetical protein
MNATQIENQIIQNSKGLPADILQEILDFIQFLKFKKAVLPGDSVQTGLSQLDASEITHLEEEFMDYKTIYPHE